MDFETGEMIALGVMGLVSLVVCLAAEWQARRKPWAFVRNEEPGCFKMNPKDGGL